jgi:hypothetical protein
MAASLDSVFKKKRDEDQPKKRPQYSKKFTIRKKIAPEIREYVCLGWENVFDSMRPA